MYDPAKKRGREIKGLSIMDVAPTILKVMDVPIPRDMSGRAYG
jgi:bisphosphoglycerate-independent phosphoglycerate mutase (AlkP superfamily)